MVDFKKASITGLWHKSKQGINRETGEEENFEYYTHGKLAWLPAGYYRIMMNKVKSDNPKAPDYSLAAYLNEGLKEGEEFDDPFEALKKEEDQTDLF